MATIVNSLFKMPTSDKRGNCCLKNNYIFLEQQSEPEGTISMDVNQFLDKARATLSLYGAAGCNTKLLDYYSECKLCSKFSFPDFRLTAGMASRQQDVQSSTSEINNSVALCENCCETILSLCVPSEPERLTGRGDTCLLLSTERNSGHRLVLSNQAKKWISADGVEAIKTITDVVTASNIADYSTVLNQKFRSYLMAVCSRAWSEPDCVTARAGFIVKPQEPNTNPPIEVKVTLRPPKSKTPPPIVTPSRGGRLQITPVPGSGRGRGGGGFYTPQVARISSTGRGRGSRGSYTPRGRGSIRGASK